MTIRFCAVPGMTTRDILTFLNLPTLPKDDACLVAFLDDQPASTAGPVKALEGEEFRAWIEAETAELPSRHAHVVREHLFGTLRKADVEGLGISRTHFNALRTKLAEKWMRVSR